MTDKKRNSKLLPSLLFYFILLLIIAGILGIVVLTNINIAENWFGLDEYTVVETRDQSEDNLFQYVSYVHDLPGGIRVSLSIDILYFITS